MIPAAAGLRMVAVSRDEAEMMVRVVQGVVDFREVHFLEFSSYCPQERWEEVINSVSSGIGSLQGQLDENAEPIMVPAQMVFALIDLEECTSGARDARLSSGRLALIISAAGAAGETILGIPWLGIPAYIISLALVLGKPLIERSKDIPAAPFKVDTLEGARMSQPRLGDHTDKAKILERVIVANTDAPQEHWWGSVRPGRSRQPGAVCLSKDRFRVRCEGWAEDQVEYAEGWEHVPMEMCESARHEICVWEPAENDPRDTPFGPVPDGSAFKHVFWVEYVGVLTGGAVRRAGPFG